MKKVIFMLLLAPSIAFGQATPQKGDNTFVISTSKSARDNYTDFAKHLIDKGYTFAVKDPEFLLITTADKRILNGNKAHKIHAIFSESDIVITAEFKTWNAGAAVFFQDVEEKWKPWKFKSTNDKVFQTLSDTLFSFESLAISTEKR